MNLVYFKTFFKVPDQWL